MHVAWPKERASHHDFRGHRDRRACALSASTNVLVQCLAVIHSHPGPLLYEATRPSPYIPVTHRYPKTRASSRQAQATPPASGASVSCAITATDTPCAVRTRLCTPPGDFESQSWEFHVGSPSLRFPSVSSNADSPKSNVLARQHLRSLQERYHTIRVCHSHFGWRCQHSTNLYTLENSSAYVYHR